MKYNDETIGKLTLVLQSGGTRQAAYGYAGISKDCFYRWLEEKPEFAEAVRAAENKARVFVESKLWESIKKGDGTSIRFWLEKRAKEDWKADVPNVETHVHLGKKDDGQAARVVVIQQALGQLDEQDRIDFIEQLRQRHHAA